MDIWLVLNCAFVWSVQIWDLWFHPPCLCTTQKRVNSRSVYAWYKINNCNQVFIENWYDQKEKIFLLFPCYKLCNTLLLTAWEIWVSNSFLATSTKQGVRNVEITWCYCDIKILLSKHAKGKNKYCKEQTYLSYFESPDDSISRFQDQTFAKIWVCEQYPSTCLIHNLSKGHLLSSFLIPVGTNHFPIVLLSVRQSGSTWREKRSGTTLLLKTSTCLSVRGNFIKASVALKSWRQCTVSLLCAFAYSKHAH